MKKNDLYFFLVIMLILCLVAIAFLPPKKTETDSKGYRYLENADSVQLETKPYKF